MKGNGEMEKGSSAELIKRVKIKVKACKKRLRTDLDRLIAVGDPKNGEGFIKEVIFSLYVSGFEIQNITSILMLSDPRP